MIELVKLIQRQQDYIGLMEKITLDYEKFLAHYNVVPKLVQERREVKEKIGKIRNMAGVQKMMEAK